MATTAAELQVRIYRPGDERAQVEIYNAATAGLPCTFEFLQPHTGLTVDNRTITGTQGTPRRITAQLAQLHERSDSLHRPMAAVVAGRREMEVPSTALAKLLDVHGVPPERVAFVRAGTQGCEAEIIETGRSLWAAGVPLFAEFDPKTWRGPRDLKKILAAATKHFTGFIAAENLIADTDPEIRPIAELPAYCRALGTDGSDVLLLQRPTHGLDPTD